MRNGKSDGQTFPYDKSENGEEMKQDMNGSASHVQMQDITRQNRREFCEKYIPILQMIEDDPDL